MALLNASCIADGRSRRGGFPSLCFRRMRRLLLLSAAACALRPTSLRSTISMSTDEPGVVLGLNAAFQRRVAFEKPLVIGAVNRAAESGGGVGGKGQGAYLAAAARYAPWPLPPTQPPLSAARLTAPMTSGFSNATRRWNAALRPSTTPGSVDMCSAHAAAARSSRRRIRRKHRDASPLHRCDGLRCCILSEHGTLWYLMVPYGNSGCL